MMNKEVYKNIEILDDTLRQLLNPLPELQENALKELYKTLTRPTEQEVCKALRDESSLTHRYYNGVFQYKSIIDRNWYNITLEPLHKTPPHLITMIGQFYEGKAQDERV